MRYGRALAVSSALLFLSIAPVPYHTDRRVEAGPSTASGHLLLSEFYACGLSDDEYFVVSNGDGAPANLRNWSVTDGEGSLSFRSTAWLAPGGSYVISTNSSSYESAFGRLPDWSPSGQNSSDTMTVTGRFRLADAGDSISLVSPQGLVFDSVIYGNCSERPSGWAGQPLPPVRSGEVIRRLSSGGGWQDTDSPSDWLSFREYRYGYTEFAPFETMVPGGAVTAFVSPDSSLGVVLGEIRSSSRAIKLCSYELDSAPVCEALLEAIGRGVSVELLVDGAPAGGISARESSCLSSLRAAGASVRLVNGNLTRDIVQHVGALHAKYMIVDSCRSTVLSENFVEDGLPSDSVCGNRGWGVTIESAEVARFLEELFGSDARRSRPDVSDWRDEARFDPGASLPGQTSPNHTVPAVPPMVSTAQAKVTIVASPDCSPARPFLVDWIAGAGSMAVEQFQADLVWETRWGGETTSPLVTAVADGVARGASARLLFDSSWFNAERNGAVVSHLAGLAPENVSSTGFKLLDERSPIMLLHNKGAVFGGATAMVSSNNWVYPSFAKNRELAALIGSQELAQYFLRAFEFDWEPDAAPPDAAAGEDMHAVVGQLVQLSASESVDDRAVVHWLWDLGSDGTYDGESECFEFYATRPGKVVVDLVVEDGWGNRGWDSVTITVDDPADGGARSAGGRAPPPVLMLSSAAIGLLAGCAIAWARARAARKINQLRPD